MRPEHEVVRLREVGERLGGRVGGDLDVVDEAVALAGDLLLEQRVQHDRRGAGVLEPLHRVERVGERRGARHERVGETKAEIGG